MVLYMEWSRLTMVQIWNGPDHYKTEEMAVILSKTIRKQNHTKTEQTPTI